MARHGEQGDQPWYRTTAATVAAGGLGAVLLAALVYAIVQFSDDWTNPAPTVLTTVGTPPPAPSTESGRAPFVITPSGTSTTFTTSVPVSTTEIAGPTGLTTTTTTSDTSGTSATTTTTTTTATTATTSAAPVTPGDEETTTRKRPRLNQTRTFSP